MDLELAIRKRLLAVLLAGMLAPFGVHTEVLVNATDTRPIDGPEQLDPRHADSTPELLAGTTIAMAQRPLWGRASGVS